MRPVDFGWDYPPGVTGNEPEITGEEPEEDDEYDEEEDALGPCGCVDYHYADCPIRTGGSHYDEPFDDMWLEDAYNDRYIRDEEYDRGEHE